MTDFTESRTILFLIDCWIKQEIHPEEHTVLLQMLELYINLEKLPNCPLVLNQLKQYLKVVLSYEYEKCEN